MCPWLQPFMVVMQAAREMLMRPCMCCYLLLCDQKMMVTIDCLQKLM